jgi:type IV pilus assembly protein PilQ
MLDFSAPFKKPTDFATEAPSRIVFDFPNVSIEKLANNLKNQSISLGVIRNLSVINNKDQARLVIDTTSLVPYITETNNNKFIITVDNSEKINPMISASNSARNTIQALDFKRGDNGEGKMILDLSNDKVPVDFSEKNGNILLDFKGATIAPGLLKDFDVTAFGTPIQKITTSKQANSILFTIKISGDVDKIAYQLKDKYILEAKPLTYAEQLNSKAQKFKFTGERISLNFQDIDVRSVLQLLADFTDLNIVASDSVTGNLTLRLEDIPWDQALDFILKSKGLSKRAQDNILWIAPTKEIADTEESELKAQNTVQQLSPLVSTFIQINYAKAGDLVPIIKGDKNTMLSARGEITVDERTNTLLIKDTAENIFEVKNLIARLDIPVRQVIIETQIVQTTSTIVDSFGLTMYGAGKAQIGKRRLGFSRNGLDALTTATTGSVTNPPNILETFTNSSDQPSDATNLLGLALSKLPGGTLLALELQALESEDKGKVVANPRLLTLDKQTASIESGEERPVVTPGTSTSPPSTTFKTAATKLEVTPQITPDNKITLELKVTKDSFLGTAASGSLALTTIALSSLVQVENGDTIVLGGIYEQDKSNGYRKIPLFGDIPIVGKLFSNSNTFDKKSETIIFVTPRLVDKFDRRLITTERSCNASIASINRSVSGRDNEDCSSSNKSDNDGCSVRPPPSVSKPRANN